MQTETLRTIKYTPQTALKMDKIALKLGRSNRVVFAQMVDYFYRSRKDPLDINDELLKNTLLKQHKDYIGFIKTQENDLLIPTKREVDRMVAVLGKVIDAFNKDVLRQNDLLVQGQNIIAGNQEVQVKKFVQTDELMRRVLDKLDSKEKLKNTFLYILDNYIKTRETFGITTPAIKKQELVQTTISQIKLL